MSENSQRPRPVRYPVKILKGTLTLYITATGSTLSRGGDTIALTLAEENWVVAEFERVRAIVRANTPTPPSSGGPP